MKRDDILAALDAGGIIHRTSTTTGGSRTGYAQQNQYRLNGQAVFAYQVITLHLWGIIEPTPDNTGWQKRPEKA